MKTLGKWLCLGFVILLPGSLVGSRVHSAPNEEAKASRALREARLNAVRKAYKEAWELYREGRSRDVDRIYLWSQRWLESERDLAGRPADQVAALESHRKRMRQLEESVKTRFRAGVAAAIEVPAVEFYRLDAEIRLEDARGQ